MPISSRLHLGYLFILSTLLFAGCGGGGASSTNGGGNTLSGTIAVGAPIAGASVFATGANGVISNTVVADTNGNYTGLDLTGLTAPILLQASGDFGQTPYKLQTVLNSTNSATANVTPITSLIASIAANSAAENLSPSSLDPNTISAAIQQAKTILIAAISPVTSVIGLDLNTNDPVSQSFATNNTGLDKLLDTLDIKIRPAEGITISNKLEPIQESATSSDRTQLSMTFAGATTGSLPSATDRDLSWIPDLAKKFEDCFALPASQRVLYTIDSGGMPVPNSVHNTCKAFVHNAYLHNSYTFGERWIFALKDSAFDNAKFKLQLVYIIDVNGTPTYVMNLNFKDKDDNGYTRPEVITQSAGSYLLYGNQREIEAYAEPMISNIADYVDATSGTNSIQGRLRFMFTPHRDWDNSTSSYRFFYDGNGKPDPQWACTWVTGPGLPGNGNLNPAESGPVGGILMKVPRSDYTAKREYLATALKFPETFDPISSQADRNQLLKACAARENTARSGPPSWEVATYSTFNTFTIDYAKPTQSSTFAWPTTNAGNRNYSWAGDSQTWNDATGTSYGNWALEPVSQSVKDAYKPTSMPMYNFYSFRLSSIPNDVYTVIGYGSIPVVDNAKSDAFFSARVVVKARMIGAMPYLQRDANNVYNGPVKFGTIGDTTLTSYLGSNAGELSGSTLNASWLSAPKGTGIDRLGFTCYGTWVPPNNTKKRWGPSMASGSWGFARSINSKTFAFEDSCPGYSFKGSTYPSSNVVANTIYRDLWIRTYDQENRQIQQVYIAER